MDLTMAQSFPTPRKSAGEKNQDTRLYFLSIQIDQYPDATPLQGCVSDGSLFIDHFNDKFPGRFEFKQIPNHQATRDNILEGCQQFLAGNALIRPGDITVLHISAHASSGELLCHDGRSITRRELEGLSRLTAKTSHHVVILDICHASSFFPDTQDYPYVILAACGEAELAAETTYHVQWPAAYGWFSLNLIRTLRLYPHITGLELINHLSNKRVNQQPRFYGPESRPIFDSPIPSTDSLRTKLKLSLLSDQQILPGSPKFLRFQQNEHTSDRLLLINLTNTSSVAFRRLDLILKKEKDKDGMVMPILSSASSLSLMRVQRLTYSLRDDLQPMQLRFEKPMELDVPYVLYARAVHCHFSRSECLSQKCAKGMPVYWTMATGDGKGDCVGR